MNGQNTMGGLVGVTTSANTQLVKESGVTNALKNAMNTLDMLHGAISNLENKLDPILTPPSPEKDAVNTPSGNTNLERDINQVAIVISRSVTGLNGLMGRMDL